eukprot:NODE_6360_length_515_cov_40.424893_g5588_i0.p2 GENE.NODE_6360_length_515_cov_40.424893_g5588_i0~~NODE_6360_length_515_cov_40.424893_g5588_i0.p2  ORF type:complete len:98 (-),score=27.27 NODE_6360_length_515_cov_40.424893_g5588_i0:189-482(-)
MAFCFGRPRWLAAPQVRGRALEKEQELQLLQTKVNLKNLLAEREFMQRKKDDEMRVRREDMRQFEMRRRAEEDQRRKNEAIERRITELSLLMREQQR